jgi:hypothetical protein
LKCEPVVFELYITSPGKPRDWPAPSTTLSGWQLDPHWQRKLSSQSSNEKGAISRIKIPFIIGNESRLPDESLIYALQNDRYSIINRWFCYYLVPLQGAAYTALNLKSNNNNYRRRICMITLEDRTARNSTLHYSLAFRAASCEIVGHDIALSFPYLAPAVNELEQFSSNQPADVLPLPILLCVPKSGPKLADNVAFVPLHTSISCGIEDGMWINHLPPPVEFMNLYMDSGFLIPDVALWGVKEKEYVCDPWGHVRPLR